MESRISIFLSLHSTKRWTKAFFTIRERIYFLDLVTIELQKSLSQSEQLLSQIKSFITLAVLRQSVQRVDGAYLRVIERGKHSSFRRNAAAVTSRWQLCVRFNRPEIWTLDLSLQKQTRYRSTNFPVNYKVIKSS